MHLKLVNHPEHFDLHDVCYPTSLTPILLSIMAPGAADSVGAPGQPSTE